MVTASRRHPRHRIGPLDWALTAWLLAVVIIALAIGGCTFTSTPGGGVHLQVLPLKVETLPTPVPAGVSNPTAANKP